VKVGLELPTTLVETCYECSVRSLYSYDVNSSGVVRYANYTTNRIVNMLVTLHYGYLITTTKIFSKSDPKLKNRPDTRPERFAETQRSL
jgi:hypothetical protein